MVYGTCFLCGKEGIMELHHVYTGALRDKSTKYGYLVPLCGESCHRTGKKSAHGCKETADALKRHFQWRYMIEHHASVTDFRREFYKSYLNIDEYEDEEKPPMNNVSLSGRLTADPRAFTTKKGARGISCRVAVKRGKKTNFFNVVTYDEKDVEFIEKYFYKGKPIEITGELEQNEREVNGNRYDNIFVVTTSVHFADPGRSERQESDSDDSPKDNEQSQYGSVGFEETDEEAPF